MNEIKSDLIDLLSDQDICENLMFGDCEIDSIGDFTFEFVDDYGGEGKGSTFFTVWKISRDGEYVFARFDGHYQSHYGVDYQGWKFVEPKQKTITVYE